MAEYLPDTNISMAIVRDDRNRACSLHTHEFSEIVLVLAGHGDHITDNNRYPIDRGDAFVLQSNLVHGFDVTDRLSLINILFNEKALVELLCELRTLPGFHALFTLEPLYRQENNFESRLRLDEKQLKTVTELVDRLEAEIEDHSAGYIPMCTSLFLQIAVYLARCYHNAQVPAAQTYLKVGRAISHIEHNYTETITITELCRLSQMSVNTLMRSFKHAIGQTPIDYLLQVRIRKARRMLERQEPSITEVAFSVGFNDSNYFSRQFRRLVGMSPREYRRAASQTHSE